MLTLFTIFVTSLDMGYDSFEYVRIDALISERLTSSPRIADIYGHCGLAIVAEFFHHGDAEAKILPGYQTSAPSYRAAPNALPQNNLTASEKLHIALGMAEAIADLHGFQDGVIVHNDIQPSQFLFRSDDHKALKLNDFNRAEVMLWDEEHQDYCRYRCGAGQGNVSFKIDSYCSFLGDAANLRVFLCLLLLRYSIEPRKNTSTIP
jgi:serine/threonine protein kinase